MAAHRMISVVVAAVGLVLTIVVQNGGLVQSRSVDGMGRMEKFLASLVAPIQDTRLIAGGGGGPLSAIRGGSLSAIRDDSISFLSDHSVEKRDSSCRGSFNRGLLKKLDRVCEDCYNLYRKPYVEIECKADCYANHVFRQCITDLLLEDAVQEYARAVQVVGK